MTVTTAYDRLLRPISLDDVLSEPEADQLFIEPSGHPKITIQTTLEIEGFTLNITLNDTSISDAVALLRRQRQPARPSAPVQPRRRRQRRTRPEPPQYQAIWSDFDDPPTERGASVVATAAELLERGMVSCWSDAIETARQTTF